MNFDFRPGVFGKVFGSFLASDMAIRIFSVLVLSVALLWAFNRELNRQFAGEASSVAGLVAAESRAGVSARDNAELERIARGAMAFPSVVSVEFARTAAPSVRVARSAELRRPVALEILRPLGPDSSLRLAFSSSAQRAALWRAIAMVAVLDSAGLLLSTLLGGFRLRNLLKPLRTLTEVSHSTLVGEVQSPGRFGERGKIGRLTEALDAMAERLSATLVSKRAAEAANAAKTRFLATMGHEFRTPLNAIIGYSQLLQDLCEERRIEGFSQDLSRIERSGMHLLGLVNQVLDYSKSESGSIRLDPESFDVLDVVDDVMDTVGPLAAGNRNRVTCHSHTSRTAIHSDLERFRQSLTNLVANACRFTHDGSVTIEVSREDEGGREWLAVAVADTGLGIAREDQARIFQPFTQVDSSATRLCGGCGLGLAITRKMCRLLGGDISLESQLGKGSRFTMRVPASSAPEGEAPAQRYDQTATGGRQ